MAESMRGGRYEQPLPRHSPRPPTHPDDLDPAKHPVTPDELAYMAEAYHNEDAAALMIARARG